MARKLVCACIAIVLVHLMVNADDTGREQDLRVIRQAITDIPAWVHTKDLARLQEIIAHDENYFEFDPGDTPPVIGYDALMRNVDFWMDPRFVATTYDIRELRINLSQSGTVAWFSCYLDDLFEWDGTPAGWKNVRWTGVLEKRQGKWVHVQFHFSYPRERKSAAQESSDQS